jgi:hypothetical protein
MWARIARFIVPNHPRGGRLCGFDGAKETA